MTHHPVAVILTGGAVAVFAQAAEAVPNVPGIVTSVTASAMMVYLCWFLVTKAIPSMQTKFGEELEKIRADHNKYLDSMENRHREEMKALREQIKCRAP